MTSPRLGLTSQRKGYSSEAYHSLQRQLAQEIERRKAAERGVMGLKFNKPLTFGDKEQIEAIKKAEAQNAFDELPSCDVCEGDSRCSICRQECEDCGGTGKDDEALREWREKYPCGRCS